MLQKLLIAFCTMFVLSACGGSSNNSAPTPTDPPDTTEPEPEEPEEPEETEEPEPEPEPEPDGWVDIQFNEEGEIETWGYRCQGCDATAELSWNEEETALVVSPSWLTDGDDIEVFGELDPEIFDMTGANALVSLYVTDDYIADGKLRAQLLFTTAAGGLGYAGNTGVVAGWNHILVEDIQVGTEDGDYGSFGWYNGDFTLDNVNTVGVQLISNEKPADVGGDLWIGSVIVSPDEITVPGGNEEEEGSDLAPIPAGDLSYRFVGDIDGWYINGEADQSTTETDNITLTHSADNESLVMTPINWDTDSYRLEARTNFDSAVDLTDAVVTFTVTVPESYITDGAVNFQLNVIADAGTAYTGYQGVGGLTAGENTITIDLSTRDEDITSSTAMGFQFATTPSDETIKDPILIRGVDIDLATAE